MRTEIIEILQKKYPEYCMQHLDTADEILRLFSVVGRSEQLLTFKEWERDECALPWDAEPKDIVEQYLSQ